MSKLVKSVSAEERKFLRKAFWRSATLYAAVSPAKQGASGFCYSLMPALNHFYKDPEKKKEALSRSMSYFNTTVPFSTFIMGLVASMGKKKIARNRIFDTASINAVKSSLMGPLAGIGDSIFLGCAPCDRSGNCSQHGTERKRIGTTCVFNTF